MLCNFSEECSYYKTYRHRSTSKPFHLLIESYCEGALREECRRLEYEKAFGKAPPENLAPNGYFIGTHEKPENDHTRKHQRYEIKDGVCELQIPGTKNTFSARILDLSLGGMKIAAETPSQDLGSEPDALKILCYTVEDIPFPITEQLTRIVWRQNQMIGCSFMSPLA